MKSLENAIESQTTISDLAALRVPVEIVYGTLDEFASPGGIRIAERLRGVTVHRVTRERPPHRQAPREGGRGGRAAIG